MKWEYASLVRRTYADDNGMWHSKFWFIGIDGTPTETGTIDSSSLPVLNQLGQEGWEVIAVEPRYAYFRESLGKRVVAGQNDMDVWADWAETLIERTMWLKRPVPTT